MKRGRITEHDSQIAFENGESANGEKKTVESGQALPSLRNERCTAWAEYEVKGLFMIHSQKRSSDIITAGSSGAAPESVRRVRTAWRPPNVTIIDIRRTTFAPGSVTDGFSGSI